MTDAVAPPELYGRLEAVAASDDSPLGGVALFDSGPHRFVESASGRLTLGPFAGPNGQPFTERLSVSWYVTEGSFSRGYLTQGKELSNTWTTTRADDSLNQGTHTSFLHSMVEESISR